MHDQEKSDSGIVAEADEQSRAAGGGAGGAKAGDQGERGAAKHIPDTGPGTCDPGAEPRTASRKAKEGREVHRAPAPRLSRHTPRGVPRAQAQGRPWSGWPDVGGLRGRPRATARRSARTGPTRSVSAAALPPDVHTEGRRETTATGDQRPGR